MESGDDDEQDDIKGELKRYCGLDTWGMLLILRKLQELSR